MEGKVKIVKVARDMANNHCEVDVDDRNETGLGSVAVSTRYFCTRSACAVSELSK